MYVVKICSERKNHISGCTMRIRKNFIFSLLYISMLNYSGMKFHSTGNEILGFSSISTIAILYYTNDADSTYKNVFERREKTNCKNFKFTAISKLIAN